MSNVFGTQMTQILQIYADKKNLCVTLWFLVPSVLNNLTQRYKEPQSYTEKKICANP